MNAEQVTSTERSARAGIDPRGPRFGAALTAILLMAAVLLGETLAGQVVLAVVVTSFALGAARGAQGTWQGLVFRSLVRPRLSPPTELEDPAPPRFAQTVGLVITGAGLILALAGVPWAVTASAAIALVAAFLNAAFGFCLGCEMYLIGRRLRRAR
ncbi:DUF4395 domain-containing protein [Bogoriella caseilytica]|uniref:Uncharacterized protein DUF4395 n=1 Tax=Bogoriella caseilytica TaxID=56055 RepID=A0A3N2B9E9_9MICO|nr:DUF4395 domain-containing protein [Bogoriella caseilytica]ROR71724.1 uncharacterized protein DUF4395 [Bogoriella caseilytica]